MMQKKDSRLRRSRATRVRIGLQKADRLTVSRTNSHIYASVISGADGKVLCSASTLEAEVRNQLSSAKGKGGGKGGNVSAAKLVGTAWPRRQGQGCESVALTVQVIDFMAGQAWRSRARSGLSLKADKCNPLVDWFAKIAGKPTFLRATAAK